MNTRTLLGPPTAVVLALTAAACSSSTAPNRSSAAPRSAAGAAASSAAAPDYVTQVNALCDDLIPKVLAVYGGSGHHTSYPIGVYRKEHPKLAAVYRAFDAQVDAIPVGAADRAADEAFDAYRRQSDAGDRKLAAPAATGKQAAFDAAFDKLVSTEGKPDPVIDAMHAAGISCNGR